MMGRIVTALAAIVAVAAGAHILRSRPLSAATVVTVYKSPSCGCCAKWVDHLRAAGFTVVAHDTDNLEAVMTAFNAPPQLASCHTAKVGPYVIEGHVPADVIAKVLREHPAIAGLAVPGMVTGSPGMEGGTPQAYDIIAWTADGHTSVYAHR